MFVRGSGSGEEYRRVDNSFYRGIVVKNNDPDNLNRVKVYIPEISTQPYDNWFSSMEKASLKSIGEGGDKWENTQIFEEICDTIPWAEPCYPILGETGDFRYVKDEKISTIGDTNYKEGFEKIKNNPPEVEAGAYSPSFLYEIEDNIMKDTFTNPTENYCVKCNPYGYGYIPSKHSNKSKGIFGVPEVGSKVWVFHYNGDLNFPVYFGSIQDSRSIKRYKNILKGDFEN